MSDISDGLTYCQVGYDGVNLETLEELSLKEVVLVESLLTPGLQTIIKYDSAPNTPKIAQNFEEFKGAIATVGITRPILKNHQD